MSNKVELEAFFKLSYGLYLVSSGNKEQGNGFISNTVFQVTADPPQFASCCNKANYTADFIQKSQSFAISVLHQDCSPELISLFGYKSGKDVNKLQYMNVQYGATGVPIIFNDCIAYFECRLVSAVDVGTHWMFIGEVVAAKLMDEAAEALTYLHYREVRKGFSPKNAPTYIDKSKLDKNPESANCKKFECTACGYVYDETEHEISFADLPDDWICPVCGSDKSDFIAID